jgi:hypothetical protein
MNWQARRKLYDLTARFIYVTALCASAFVGGLLISKSEASSFDGIYTPEQTFKPGDLITLPNRKGNYLMILWGDSPVFYNAELESIQSEPIRNYSTVYVDVTRKVPEGDYQAIEIDAIADPRNVSNWRWLREYKIRIVKCDEFRVVDQAICKAK